ncbi:MAG: MqnA/MqnD/SBP family protein [Phycisphaerales bacterium]
MLLIGDKVITGAPPENLFPHQVDLGQAWHEWTGQPFVYAAWMCRADEADRPEIALAAALLDRQRRKNLVRLASLAAEHGPAAGWPVDLAERYLASHLRFDLGPRERAAAQRFIDECAALGLCPPAPLRWADWHNRPRGDAGVTSIGAAGSRPMPSACSVGASSWAARACQHSSRIPIGTKRNRPDPMGPAG